MKLCMHTTTKDEREWVCLKPEHEDEHEYSPVHALATLSAFKLTCDHCGKQRAYALTLLRVTLYSHGICSVSFDCPFCGDTTEVKVPDQVAIDLDRKGVPTTVVHTPGEVLEWPALEVPAISVVDVELLERSSVQHFNERFRLELGSLEGG